MAGFFHMIARSSLVMRVWSVSIRLASVPTWMRHLMSYGFIGAACACMSNLVVIASSLAGFKYWNAAALSFVLVTPLGYVLQSWLTFGVKLSVRRFIRFAGNVAIGALILIISLGLFNGVCGIPIWIVSPLVSVVVFCWNYAASLWAVSYFGKADLNAPAAVRYDIITRSFSLRSIVALPCLLQTVIKHSQEALKS